MIVRSAKDLPKVLEILKKSLTWTYDIETDGLDTRNGRIIGFGCTNPETYESFYIVMKAFEDSELKTIITKEELLPVFKALKSKRLLTFNGSFDTRFTLNYTGINLIESIYADVMLLKHTCDEEQPFRLKDIAAMLFGDEAKAAQQDMLESIKANGGSEKEFYKADSGLMAKYGIQDGILTARVYNHYLPKLKADGLFQFFFDDEVMPLYRLVTIPMELKGIPVDVPLMQKAQAEITIDLDTLENSIQAQIAPLLTEFNEWFINKSYPVALSGQFLNTLATLIAPPEWPKTKAGTYSFSTAAFKKKRELLNHDLMLYKTGAKRLPKDLVSKVQAEMHADSGIKYAFNISSKDNLKRLFFTKLNEIPTSKTDKGNPQVESDFIEAMAEKYPWASEILTYNKLTKIKGTYIDRYLEKQEGGVYYPSFFQHRTLSGRYGSDIQQLPRPLEGDTLESKYTNLIRQFFTAGTGNKLVDADYESLEPHIFAHVSGDEKLKNIFRQGHDFYSTIAVDTEGLTEYSPDKSAPNYLGKLNKQARQTAKAYALGIPYGMGAYALSMNLRDTGMNISDTGAQALINKYLRAYPELSEWMERSNNFAKQHGQIRTEAGRIRRFPRLVELIRKYSHMDYMNNLEVWKNYNDYDNYDKIKEDIKYIKNCLNNAKNVQIQSLGASIVNRSSIKLAKELKAIDSRAYICAQIHDQVIVICPDESVEKAKVAVKDCLENTYKISLNLKAEPNIGDNFAESKG